MATPSVITRLAAAGVTLAVHGDRIRLIAPAGVITDQDRAEIRYHRDEIIAALAPTPTSETDATTAPTPVIVTGQATTATAEAGLCFNCHTDGSYPMRPGLKDNCPPGRCRRCWFQRGRDVDAPVRRANT